MIKILNPRITNSSLLRAMTPSRTISNNANESKKTSKSGKDKINTEEQKHSFLFKTTLEHRFPDQCSYPDTNLPSKSSTVLEFQKFDSVKNSDIIPPEPTLKFGSLDEQLEYEIKKCLENLSGGYRIGSMNKLTKNMIASDITKPKSKPKSKSKQKDQARRFLSMGEAIEIVNLRDHNLLSIDVEYYERSHGKLLEVGISIYNPKYQRIALYPHFFNIHLIIKENLSYRNGIFVPDSRMSNLTGESMVIPLHSLPKAINLIFEKLGPKTIIVGHNVKGDLKSMEEARCEFPVNIPFLDTMTLWQSLVEDKNKKSSLTYILDKLGVPNSFLHNGVNDAYYTLVACLMLCSPDLRNNLALRKKSESVADCNKDLNGSKNGEVSEDELETYSVNSTLSNEEGESKKCSIRLRCEVTDKSILVKNGRLHAKSRDKTRNPPANHFFKPVIYNKDNLEHDLEELNM